MKISNHYEVFGLRIWGECHEVTGRAGTEINYATQKIHAENSRRADELRKQNTPAEQNLWAYLRLMREDVNHFCRQYAIGPFITDFSPKGTMCAPRRKLIIELDGSQHFEQEEYDEERAEFLASQGYKVIRFWNNEVMTNIEGVIESSACALETNVRGSPR